MKLTQTGQKGRIYLELHVRGRTYDLTDRPITVLGGYTLFLTALLPVVLVGLWKLILLTPEVFLFVAQYVPILTDPYVSLLMPSLWMLYSVAIFTLTLLPFIGLLAVLLDLFQFYLDRFLPSL